jgi:hypothetical protein
VSLNVAEEPSADLQTPVDSVRSEAAPRDLQRTFQLVLATVWLLDAVLQIQPFMFTPGSSGFSGMIGGTSAGNPTWISHTITWNASIVDHNPILTNTLFALTQFLIAFGIAWRRTCKAALALSIVWSLGVWWFGEGLGSIFSGGATPFGGGPGGVLFYAVLAAMLWPREGLDPPFVAARALGVRGAKVLWTAVWAVLAALCLVGSGRSPSALAGLVTKGMSNQPGWLVHLNRFSVSFLQHDGTTAAVLLALLCCAAAISVYLPAPYTQTIIVLVVVTFAFIWIAVEDFGGILAGGATDPNSGPLVVLMALLYWPITRPRRPARQLPGSSCGSLDLAGANGHSTRREA